MLRLRGSFVRVSSFRRVQSLPVHAAKATQYWPQYHKILQLTLELPTMRRPILAIFAAVASVSFAQDYGDNYADYADGQDNLYANYAAKQEAKTVGGGGGGGGLPKLLAAGFGGWLLGAKIHSGRATKKLKKVHQKEQKNLYTQYYNDVYKLQEKNAELQYTANYLKEQLEATQREYEDEKTQRDYDEFKQPDVDGDDRISRAEFNIYVKEYLSNYPGLKPEDYPRFEDFDHDNDGFINFAEYSQQMAYQTKQAEQETYEQARRGNAAEAQRSNYKADALRGLSGETRRADNFDDLYANYGRY